MQEKKYPFYVTLLFCILLCVGGGWLTGLITESGVRDWYPHLIKSSKTPPDFFFPIVWTILYTLMAIALALLIHSGSQSKERAYLFFLIQLFLNFIWSGIFFYLHSPGFALIDLTCLWIFVVLTIGAFWRHTRLGSYLLVPYLFWISYAYYLNYFIWVNN